jgi:GDP-mannose 6-dehydrogenase
LNISIFGLGYVGSVSLACLARDGHEVIGVDVDPDKLALISAGTTPIIEAGMAELMDAVVTSGNVTVTDDVRAGIEKSDVSFICVGTPTLSTGEQDQSIVLRLVEDIGAALKDKQDYHVVVVRSTVLPGTVSEKIVPLLESASGKNAGDAFDVCFQPEFLREGSSIRDYDNPPFTVVGTASARAAERLRELFGHLPCEFITASVRTAEMLKYCCNVFHALKITFANEIGRICQSLDVDSHEVMELVCRDRQLNISTAYMRPGFAFGGSCLPKDTKALTRMARTVDVEVPMLSGLMPSNRVHVERAAEVVTQRGAKTIAMVGLSFKAGTDDLRESPLVTLAETFIGKGLQLRIHDPAVSLARLMGANKRYIEEAIPHIASLLRTSLGETTDGADLIVLGRADTDTLAWLQDSLQPGQLLLDLVGIPNRGRLRSEYIGACW